MTARARRKSGWFSLLLVALAVVCEVFGNWRLNTVGGRAVFDEMAGLVPFASQVLGGLFALGALLLWWLRLRRPR